MSEKYNKAFLKDPIEFSRDHSLRIGVAPWETDLKDRTTYASVSSAQRVVYWNIREEKENEEGLPLCEVHIVREPEKGYLSGFWLPWSSNSLYKITLRDKRTDPPDTHLAFFTANLTGCSIFVEGTRTTPTVYHANAMNENLGTTDVARRDHRAAVMEGRWASAALPKRAIRGDTGIDRSTFHGRALHARDYMYHREDFDEWREKLYREVDIEPEKVMVHQDLGTVFGVNDGGDWTFYVQPLILVRHMGSSSSLTTWLRKPAVAFWPGGSGAVVSHLDVPRAMPHQEMGHAGKTLRQHLQAALTAYDSRWKFSPSAQSKAAVPILKTILRNRSHPDILRAVLHYLGLDDKPVPGIVLSAALKVDSSLYTDLNTQYRLWRGL